jgi:NADH:ubiquinone oxidoreductase subunit E
MNTEAILKRYEPVEDNLLLILHDLQNSNPRNYLETDDLDRVVRYLNLTRSAVYGVVQYYGMFSLDPRGKHIIRMCISPVCRLLKGIDVLGELESLLKIKVGETTADGLFTLEESECLGHCDRAPVLMLDEEIHGNLTRDSLLSLIDRIREQAAKDEKKGKGGAS